MVRIVVVQPVPTRSLRATNLNRQRFDGNVLLGPAGSWWPLMRRRSKLNSPLRRTISTGEPYYRQPGLSLRDRRSRPHIGVMHLDLTDEEAAALTRLLRRRSMAIGSSSAQGRNISLSTISRLTAHDK